MQPDRKKEPEAKKAKAQIIQAGLFFTYHIIIIISEGVMWRIIVKKTSPVFLFHNSKYLSFVLCADCEVIVKIFLRFVVPKRF
ncbi:MAG: hypothetical protein EBQ92_03970 [Proteobacteria bacterium]|nr:hypothetical protein [Pseudomonadota bacterium]